MVWSTKLLKDSHFILDKDYLAHQVALALAMPLVLGTYSPCEIDGLFWDSYSGYALYGPFSSHPQSESCPCTCQAT